MRQFCLSVDWLDDRPCPRVDRSVDWDQQRALSFSQSTASVDRLLATVDRAVHVHVVHVGPYLLACCKMRSRSFLASDLCAISSNEFLYFSEDFLNLS